jgi:hypothetical protein
LYLAFFGWFDDWNAGGMRMEKEENIIDGAKLRQLAEEALEEAHDDHGDLSGISPKEMTGLIHELRVHQIELKMQNEELRSIQGELEKERNRYSHLYDFAPVGYFTVSEKGIVVEALQRSDKLTHLCSDKLIHRFAAQRGRLTPPF